MHEHLPSIRKENQGLQQELSDTSSALIDLSCNSILGLREIEINQSSSDRIIIDLLDIELDANEKKKMRGVDDIEDQLLVIDGDDLLVPSRNKSVLDDSALADPSLIKYGQHSVPNRQQNQDDEGYGRSYVG